MTHPVRLAILALAAGALVAPSIARAQSNEFRMDQSGNLVQTRPAAEPGTDEATIADARRALAQDRPGDAKAILDAWISPRERTTSLLMAEALFYRGDAISALGDEYEALYDYEQVIKEYPATEYYVLAVQRELDIGIRYLTGLDRRFFGMRMIDATDIGEELLIRVQERMPGSRLAERAGIELADYYYRERELALAVEAYDLFITNYPNSQYIPKAMQRRIYATIGRFKGPQYDGAPLMDAKIRTRPGANLYPQAAQEAGLDDGLITRLDESAGQEMLESANYYFAKDDPISARYVLKRLIRAHPRTAAAAQALEIMQKNGWAVTDPAKPASEKGPAKTITTDDPSAVPQPDVPDAPPAPASPEAKP